MPSAQNGSSALACRFMAELMVRTSDIADDEAYQQAVQAFVDELRPWMPPLQGPFRPYAPLLTNLQLNEQADCLSFVFTPEGLACFRAWLRRQGLDPLMATS